MYLFRKSQSIKSNLPTGEKSFASVRSLNKINRTALHIAARFGDAECVKTLYESGANIEARDKQGKTPLQLAQWKSAEFGCAAVNALIDAHAKTDYLSQNEVKAVEACAPSKYV